MDQQAAILSSLAALHRKVDLLMMVVGTAPKLSPREALVVDLIGDTLGACAMTTSEIIFEAGRDFGDRPQLLAALRALDGELDPRRIGMALRGVANAGGTGQRWRLGSSKADGGCRVWTVGPAGDLVP